MTSNPNDEYTPATGRMLKEDGTIVNEADLLQGIANGLGDNLDYIASLNSSGNPEYIGYAPPGTATSAALWHIRKVVYSGSTTTILSVKHADGTPAFNKIWDNRASYTY